MQEPDDCHQYGTSPVSVKGSPKAVSTGIGDFILSPVPANYRVDSPPPSDDESSNLLNQQLEDISLEQGQEEIKTRKDRISIDSTDSVKSASSEEIDLVLPERAEQKQRLEALNIVAPRSVVVDAESNSEITTQIVVDMSKENADLGRQLEFWELKSRHDALSINILQERCQALTLQLQALQQHRQAQIRESARLEQARVASESQKMVSESQEKAVQAELKRVGY